MLSKASTHPIGVEWVGTRVRIRCSREFLHCGIGRELETSIGMNVRKVPKKTAFSRLSASVLRPFWFLMVDLECLRSDRALKMLLPI